MEAKQVGCSRFSRFCTFSLLFLASTHNVLGYYYTLLACICVCVWIYDFMISVCMPPKHSTFSLYGGAAKKNIHIWHCNLYKNEDACKSEQTTATAAVEAKLMKSFLFYLSRRSENNGIFSFVEAPQNLIRGIWCV